MTGLEYIDVEGKIWAYQLLDKPLLGFGAFGQVHLAQAAIDGTVVRKIAVKKIAIGMTRDYLESELKKKRENSWQHLFSLNHPNIIKYYGAQVTSPSIVRSIDLLMEYCSGESLDNLLLARKIPATFAPIYAKQILEGLRYLHEYNPRIAHTDLTPRNIMRYTDYPLGPGNLKICDLDDPIVLNGSITRNDAINQCKGSLSYFSPEMAALFPFRQSDVKKLRVGSRTDIWSLGCVVLDVVCGTYPRPVTIKIPQSESADTHVRTVERNNYSEHEDLLRKGGIPFPVLPKDLPADLEQFLNRCFTFEPDKRSTAAELLQDPFFTQLCTVPLQLEACPDSFTVDELKQLSVGCCCWTQSAPGAVLHVDIPDTIQKFEFYLSDLMKGIQVFKELGKKAFIELTIRHLKSQFWANSAALQTLLQDISTHIVVLRFRWYPGWSSKSLAGLSLPNLLELRFERCDELRFFNGDFIGCAELRAITLISSTFEVFENFLEQVPKLVFMHFNVQWEEHETNDDMKNRKLKVSRHIQKLCLSEYNWLRSFMNQNPCMAMLKRAGDIWKIGPSENVNFEECFTECLGEDSSHNQREIPLPMPSFNMNPVSISDRESVQRMVKALGPGVKIDFGSLEDEESCIIWSVQCDGKVPSAEFKELCDFLAGLQASHPIRLTLTDCRPNLVKEVSQLQEAICFLRFFLIKKFESRHIKDLVLPNVLELRWERCSEVVLTTGSLDGFPNLRVIVMSGTTVKTFYTRVFDKLTQLQLLALWRDYKDVDPGDLLDQLDRFDISRDFRYTRDFIKMRPWLVEQKHEGEIYNFLRGSSSWTSLPYDACESFLALVFASDPSHKRTELLPRLGLPNLPDSQLASLKNYSITAEMVLYGRVKLSFPSHSSKKIGNLKDGIAAAAQICRENALKINVTCSELLENDLLVPLSENVTDLSINTIDKFDGSLLSRIEFPRLDILDFFQCHDLILDNSNFVKMPVIRIIDLQYSTIKPPEPSQTIFGDLDNLSWIALHFGLRSRLRNLSGGINWDKCTERERKYILELYTYPQFEGVRQLLKEKSYLTAGYGRGELYDFGHTENIELPADEMFIAEEIESLKLYMEQMVQNESLGLKLPNLIDYQLTHLKKYSITAKMILNGLVELSFPSYSSTNIEDLKDGIAVAAQICRENALQINVTCSELLENDMLVPLSGNVTDLIIKTIDNFDGSLLSRIEFPRLNGLGFFKCHDLILDNSNFVKMPGLRIINLRYSTIKPPEPSQTIFGDLDNLGWIALHRRLRSRSRRLSGGINWDKCTEHERKYILELYTYPQFEGVRQLLKEKSHLTAGYGVGELFRLEHFVNSEVPADEMFIAEEIESLKLYMAQMVINYQLTHPKKYSITAEMVLYGLVELSFSNYSSTNIENLKEGIAAAAQICMENALLIHVTRSEILEKDLLTSLSGNVIGIFIDMIDNFDGSLLSRIEFPRLCCLSFFQCHDLILDNSNFVKMPGLRSIDFECSTIKPPEPSQTIFGDLDNLGWIALHRRLRSRSRRLSGGINWDKCTEHERKYILELYTYPQFEGVRQLLKEKSHLTAGYGVGELYRLEHSASPKLEADEMFTPEEIESLKLYLA
ncbi:putative Serine/threonine-protein kinase SSK22 [Hypsibius exemplaris]|uniref:Serine/threonine-protein kinase SSK22 n=1 Tax=Hypsibius exemplaris TaxID=2072580 RepID=A0A1W0X3X0_HYPEX|nr:putative Serine/threonine-protein kinase SSK22 [Hypsibius exemplaris]